MHFVCIHKVGMSPIMVAQHSNTGNSLQNSIKPYLISINLIISYTNINVLASLPKSSIAISTIP